jgi:hypothetical protein
MFFFAIQALSHLFFYTRVRRHRTDSANRNLLMIAPESLKPNELRYHSYVCFERRIGSFRPSTKTGKGEAQMGSAVDQAGNTPEIPALPGKLFPTLSGQRWMTGVPRMLLRSQRP